MLIFEFLLLMHNMRLLLIKLNCPQVSVLPALIFLINVTMLLGSELFATYSKTVIHNNYIGVDSILHIMYLYN